MEFLALYIMLILISGLFLTVVSILAWLAVNALGKFFSKILTISEYPIEENDTEREETENDTE